MNTKPLARLVQALVSRAPGYSKRFLCLIFLLFSAAQAFAWTDGELLIWISSNRPFHALSDLAKTFEKEIGAPVKIETQEQIIDSFQSAAQSGKGPDIFFWANDRIGEWANSGLLMPLNIKEEFRAKYLPMSWDAVTHKRQVWGYPGRRRSSTIRSSSREKCLLSFQNCLHLASNLRLRSSCDRDHVRLQDALLQLAVSRQRLRIPVQEDSRGL
jgi:hypothetical protein